MVSGLQQRPTNFPMYIESIFIDKLSGSAFLECTLQKFVGIC